MTTTLPTLALRSSRGVPLEHLEVERKYDAETSTPWIDLCAVPGVAAVEKMQDLTLDAVYFDTASYALGTAKITLRSRTGGTDDGWTLNSLRARTPVGS